MFLFTVSIQHRKGMKWSSASTVSLFFKETRTGIIFIPVLKTGSLWM